MKQTLMIAALCTTTLFATAQKLSEDKVPAPVKAKFKTLYPAMKEVKWEMEKADYEAGFEVNKTETSVVIDAQGNLKETETEIAVSALPKAAADYIAKNHPGAKIAEAAKIVDASGKVTYEAEVNKKDLVFNEKGNFLK